VPYGVGSAFVSYLMPYFASHANIELDEIGWYTTLLFVPTWFQFLYAPVIDLGPSRRYWLIIVAVLGGACFAGACITPLPDHLSLFLLLAFVGQTVSGLVGSCNGGLMATTIPDDQRGAAGASYNIGNLSGGALSAAIIILMTASEAPPIAIAAVMILMMIAPSLAVLAMYEPPRDRATQASPFRSMIREVAGVIFSKSGITGIALCLSPVGTAALSNSFTGMTDNYNASGLLVGVINGPANALLTAFGSFVGGKLCDRYNRRAMYLLSGALTAICGLIMSVSPHDQSTYAFGVSAYYLVMGLCFSAFTATVLETIGHGDAAAATKYTLFTAAGNVAIAYTNLIDTRFYNPVKVWKFTLSHPDALLRVDALLNIGGCVLLGCAFWYLGSFGRSKHVHEKLVPEPEPKTD